MGLIIGNAIISTISPHMPILVEVTESDEFICHWLVNGQNIHWHCNLNGHDCYTDFDWKTQNMMMLTINPYCQFWLEYQSKHPSSALYHPWSRFAKESLLVAKKDPIFFFYWHFKKSAIVSINSSPSPPQLPLCILFQV